MDRSVRMPYREDKQYGGNGGGQAEQRDDGPGGRKDGPSGRGGKGGGPQVVQVNGVGPGLQRVTQSLFDRLVANLAAAHRQVSMITRRREGRGGSAAEGGCWLIG